MKRPSPNLDVRPPADPDTLEHNGTGNSSSSGSERKAGAQPGNQNARKDNSDSEEEDFYKAGADASSSPPPDFTGKVSGSSASTGTGAGGKSQGEGSGDDPDTDLEFSDDELDKAFKALQREATSAVAAEIRRQSKIENLGRPLHRPLGKKTRPEKVIYVDASGKPSSATVSYPRVSSLKFQHLKAEQKKQGRAMAQYLKNVRDQTEERIGMQTRGKLDRGRFVAALKGAKDVYDQSVETTKTSFVASVNLDQSGSMGSVASAGTLYNATMILAYAFEELEMPYEVRGFSHQSFQYKALEDKEFDQYRAEQLTTADGGTSLAASAGVATTALAARPEANKLQIIMTDGGVGDHQETASMLLEARKRGVATFGMFFGPTPPEERLNELYGQGNWVALSKLEEMPRAVGLKIANMLKRIR